MLAAMAYMEKEYQLLSKKDGLALAVLFKGPAENHVDRCRGIVQIVHGMSEYKERYRPFMTYLAEHGFASIIHDHRGHGNSVRSEADYGFMYEVGTDGFLEDVLQVNELAVQLLPDKPVIMVGHSMGSLAARSLMREHDGCVDAMILSGAPCKNPAVNVAMGLAAFQKKLFGPHHKAAMLERMSFMTYVSRFWREKSRFAWVCADPQVVEAYDRDPKCGFTFTVDGFQVLFELMKRTYTKEGWKCSNPKLPILFVAGGEDPCIANEAKYQEEQQFLKDLGYRDVQAILYDNMRHEIFNEQEKYKVFDDIQRFLTQKGF